MNKKDKISKIQAFLDEFFPNPSPPLHHKDPYTLLIAVLLSASCTDERVNKITPILFKLADTPEKMEQVPVLEVEKIIHPCGLHRSKSKAIVALSKVIVEKYNGKVPEILEELEELPGVGHKTASVVVGQAFNKAAFPVDTHIHRLAKRWNLTSGKNRNETERDLKRLFPKSSWLKVHIQMILYGRAFCPAKAHSIDKCPICHFLSESSSKKEAS